MQFLSKQCLGEHTPLVHVPRAPILSNPKTVVSQDTRSFFGLKAELQILAIACDSH